MTKKQLYKMHGWAGLFCIIPFMLICLTGSILVFKTEIDMWLMPDIAAVVEGEQRLSANQLLQQIHQHYPDYELGSWELLGNNGEADRIYLIKQGTDTWYKAHINPFTGDKLSEPTLMSHYLTDWLLELHYTLLLNDIRGLDEHLGTAFTSIFALLLIFLGISGLIIYRHFWRRIFTLRWDQRLLVVFSDLHKMVGTLASPILLVLGITGGYYNIAIYVHEWQEHQDGQEHHKISARLYNSDLNFEQLFTQTEQYLTGFETTYVLMPTEPKYPITLFGKVSSNNPLLSDYGSTLTFDAQTGNLLNSYDIRQQSFVMVMVDTFRKLHFGNFAGLTSKVIYTIVGLTPLLLGITGAYLWISRRNKRARKSHSINADSAVLNSKRCQN